MVRPVRRSTVARSLSGSPTGGAALPLAEPLAGSERQPRPGVWAYSPEVCAPPEVLDLEDMGVELETMGLDIDAFSDEQVAYATDDSAGM